MTGWTFRALDFSAFVRTSIPESEVRLEALLGGYEAISDHSEAACRYLLGGRGDRYLLQRNEESCYEADNLQDLLDFFQIDLYKRIVESSPSRWLLHAAALSRATKVVVLAGPSNAGKSTLCRALMTRGWDYLTEETVSLGDGCIDALRRPLHLDAPEQFASLPTSLTPVIMRETTPPMWIAKPPEWPETLHKSDLRLAALVRVQYRPEAATLLTRLDDGSAREALWPCRMNSGIEVAQLAARLIAKTPCYRLDAADIESALDALHAIALD